jgi:polyphosphate kinase
MSRFRKLLVAPVNMRSRFLELIEREIEHKRAGRPARIIAKINQLDDVEIAQALCAASRAGVPIDLLVRGFCCLRAGVTGWTENITVRSIIGRFLEHSRIFYFADGQDDPLAGQYYIGSADWMVRNLSRRVEAATPVEDRPLRERLWEILQASLSDRRQAWEMQPDGTYLQAQPEGNAPGPDTMGTHAWLMEMASHPEACLTRRPGIAARHVGVAAHLLLNRRPRGGGRRGHAAMRLSCFSSPCASS